MIEQSLFISLCVLAIWSLFWDGMILGFIGNWLEAKFPKSLYKMLAGCPICQCPYYGVLIYILKYGVTEDLPWVILMAMGWNVLVVKFLPENWYSKDD